MIKIKNDYNGMKKEFESKFVMLCCILNKDFKDEDIFEEYNNTLEYIKENFNVYDIKKIRKVLNKYTIDYLIDMFYEGYSRIRG